MQSRVRALLLGERAASRRDLATRRGDAPGVGGTGGGAMTYSPSPAASRGRYTPTSCIARRFLRSPNLSAPGTGSRIRPPAFSSRMFSATLRRCPMRSISACVSRRSPRIRSSRGGRGASLECCRSCVRSAATCSRNSARATARRSSIPVGCLQVRRTDEPQQHPVKHLRLPYCTERPWRGTNMISLTFGITVSSAPPRLEWAANRVRRCPLPLALKHGVDVVVEGDEDRRVARSPRRRAQAANALLVVDYVNPACRTPSEA